MKKLATALFLAFTLTMLAGSGCTTSPTGQPVAVTPKSPVQTIYALEVSLTAAVNAVADLHGKGILVGPNYDKAKGIEKQAHATLIDARTAATQMDAVRGQVYLTTLASLIDDLAKLNGGVK